MSFGLGSLIFGTIPLFRTCKKAPRTASRWETTDSKCRKLSPAPQEVHLFFFLQSKCCALILLWWYVVTPKVHGQKAVWEDPVEWVRGSLPWPSAQQDQAKLFHLPPPSVGSSSPGQACEARPHKETPPSSMESDPLVKHLMHLVIIPARCDSIANSPDGLEIYHGEFSYSCLNSSLLRFRWQCFWNFRRRPITLNLQTRRSLVCLNSDRSNT